MLKALFYPDVKFDTLYIPYIYKEIYFDGVYKDILNGQKDMVIADIGANIGVTVQHFRDYAKKVYAVEPSPEHFEALAKNKEFNGWDNVDVFNYAIADKDGEMEFAINSGNRTMNTLVVGEEVKEGEYEMNTADGFQHRLKTDLKYKERIKVKTKGMDTFFEEAGIDTVDFMKFDVEGSEDLILRSPAFKKVANKVKSIEIEFHLPTWTNLADYMVSLGYTPRRYPCSAIVLLFTR